MLQLHSADVLHALYIPAFRIQRNAVPGRTTEMWFQPTEIGTYHVFCTQYCGNGHSLMTTEAVVLDEAGYSAKLARAGQHLRRSGDQAAAALCRGGRDPVQEQRLRAVPLRRRLARARARPGRGSTSATTSSPCRRRATRCRPSDDDAKWDAYLRESILDPGAKIVQGYQNVMPSYASQFSGSPYKDKKLAAIVEYIKSLDNHGPGGKPKYYRPMPTPVADDAAKPTGQTVPPTNRRRRPRRCRAGKSEPDRLRKSKQNEP